MAQNSNSKYSKTVLLRALVLLGVFACALGMWFLKKGCIIKSITGIPCPSCGMTSAFFAFINGNVKESFELHPMLLSIPVLAIMFMFYDKIFDGKFKIPSTIIFILIIFGFVINYIYQLSLIF